MGRVHNKRYCLSLTMNNMASPTAKRNSRVFSMPFGSHIRPEGGVCYRIWAPSAGRMDLCLHIKNSMVLELPMKKTGGGWFETVHDDSGPGTSYQFKTETGMLVPDPCSRFQAGDVHGPSLVYDPASFCWQDGDWPGRPWEEAVIYELHVGTFSPQGTYQGVTQRLDYLAQLGVTAIELMPIAQFPGRFNWGYDGTLLFAPCNIYGTPDQLKEMIQTAHAKGIMVFLDVVYNHFGAEGNYLHVYAREAFFNEDQHTPWGSAINFDGPQSRTVRDFYIANALYWLEEYHFDGLRFDAVHAIFDNSRPDILEEIAMQVRQGPGTKRHIHLVLENDQNKTKYLERTPEGRTRLYDAQWNDDIHHACHVLLTEETAGYYMDYADSPLSCLIRCLSEGFAYQGEISEYRNGTVRGESSGHLPPAGFVSFLQNHDQVGNRAFGERLLRLCAPEDMLVAAALLLLAPSPPLLFMGEEFAAETPFYFFSDFGPELAESVTDGRRNEFAKFSQFSDPKTRERIPDPNSDKTFTTSKLDWSRIGEGMNRNFLANYREILRCRRLEIMPRLKGMAGGKADFLPLGSKAFQGRWVLGDGARLTVLFNLGPGTVKHKGTGPTGSILYRYPRDGGKTRQGEIIPPGSITWLLDTQK